MNAGRVTVARRPVVALIPTGDELVMPGEAPGPDQIVSSNSFGLKALLEAAGARRAAAADRPRHPREPRRDLRARRRRRPDRHPRRRLGRRLRPRAADRARPRPGARLLPGRDAAGKAADGRPPRAACRWSACPATRSRRWSAAAVFLRPAVARMQGLPGDLPAPLPARLGCDLGPNGPRAHYMRARVEPRRRRLALHPLRAPGQLAPVACWPRPTRSWSARRVDPARREGEDG